MQTTLPAGVAVNRHGPSKLYPTGTTAFVLSDITAPALGHVDAFEGLVAGPSLHSGSIVTSPNAMFVPRFAIAHSEVVTFTDGRWGRHEYSRWPQAYNRDQPHVACIPKANSEHAPKSDVLFRTWEQDDWTTKNSGVVRMGQLLPSLLRELERAAEGVILDINQCCNPDESTQHTQRFLTMCLRHCLDRLRVLPADRAVIVALAAHVQRLSLELAGLRVYLQVVAPRMLSSQDYRYQVLDVIGAHTGDPSLAQLLHRVGVPVWFQQPFRPSIPIWHVVSARDLPFFFSSTPAYPRLVLAVRDLSGALNTPGEVQRALTAAAHRQLCASRLPSLLRMPQLEAGPAHKKVKLGTQWPNKWDSTLGDAHPVYLERDERDGKTLPHQLKSVAPRAGPSRPRAARNRPPGPSAPLGQAPKASFVMNPFRKYYVSRTMHLSPVWLEALTSLDPLPQPSASVTYYFAPPWMLDYLEGYEAPRERLVRYLHHLASIRMFCRLRLFDATIAGRPLTISEWRDALWGDYELDDVDRTPERSGDRAKDEASARLKVRHRLKQSVRELFGQHAGLASYSANAVPEIGNEIVTAEAAATNERIQHRLVWEAHETNWRCELLALDALMVGSANWGQMERWTREAHVSEVWGPPRSGMDICPDWEASHVPFCWTSPPDGDWELSRPHLRAFVELLSRWPGRPAELGEENTIASLSECGPQDFMRVQTLAVTYYIRTFISKFQRLPTPPVRDRFRRSASPLPPPNTVDVVADTTPEGSLCP